MVTTSFIWHNSLACNLFPWFNTYLKSWLWCLIMFQCIEVIWAIKADRFIPMLMLVKAHISVMLSENWIGLACNKVFGIRSQFVSLHVLQVWNTLINVNLLHFLNCGIEKLNRNLLNIWCFFFRYLSSLSWRMSSFLVVKWLKFGCWR
jgi:hypothetical protein